MNDFQLNFIIDKQTVRILKILNFFEHKPSTTLKDICSSTDLPARTVIKDISEIKMYFNNVITLETSSKGYFFKVKEYSNYTKLKRSLLQEEPLFIVIENVFFSYFQTIPEIADQLHLSESTMLRYLKKLQSLLSDWGIVIDTLPIDFQGKEINIRHFFHEFYFVSEITPHTVFPTLAIKNISTAITKNINLEECNPISFEDFNYKLYITLVRFYNNKNISGLPEKIILIDENKKKKFEHVLSNEILQYFEVDLNWEEKKYIYLITICKRSIFDTSSEIAFQATQSIPKKIKDWEEKYLELIESNENKKNIYRLFIRSFFLSINLKYHLSPIMLNQITDITNFTKINYPVEFKINKKFILNTLSNDYELTESQLESIVASLTLFTDTLLIVHANLKKKIVFFLEGNPYICENIQATATNYLSHHHLYFPNRHNTDIDYMQKQKFDILVTNYSDFFDYDFDADVSILFETIPTADNWNQLFKLINHRHTQLHLIKKENYNLNFSEDNN